MSDDVIRVKRWSASRGEDGKLVIEVEGRGRELRRVALLLQTPDASHPSTISLFPEQAWGAFRVTVEEIEGEE